LQLEEDIERVVVWGRGLLVHQTPEVALALPGADDGRGRGPGTERAEPGVVVVVVVARGARRGRRFVLILGGAAATARAPDEAVGAEGEAAGGVGALGHDLARDDAGRLAAAGARRLVLARVQLLPSLE
jgi:hypothetical protein